RLVDLGELFRVFRQLFRAGSNHDQFQLADGDSRRRRGLRRRFDVDDQAVLSARHCEESLGQQIGVEQRAMQRACRIVDLVALAQRIQTVSLSRIQLARQLQRIDDIRAVLRDRLQIEQVEFAIEEPGVERRVVDYQLGAAYEIEQFLD